MKEVEFLKKQKFINKGIYDNQKIYENTLESIKNALNKKEGLYLTIRQTKDYKYVVYEERTLSRMHNLKDKVEDITYDELSYLSFYHIPLLEEVLKLVNGNVPIIFSLKIKIKHQYILKLLDNYKKDFAIVSSDSKLLRYISKTYPNFIIGEVINRRMKFSFSSLFIKPDFYSYNIKYFDLHKLQELKKENKLVIGYIINNKETLKNYKDNFDNLIIDNYANVINK